MWHKIAKIILRNRVVILIVLGLVTTFMAVQIPKNRVNHDVSGLLPKSDSTASIFTEFTSKYGVNDNVFFISTEDESIFELDNYRKLEKFTEGLTQFPAVDSVFGLTNFYFLGKNNKNRTFELKHAGGPLETQEELDELRSTLYSLPFFENLLYSNKSPVTLFAVVFNGDSLATRKRNQFVLPVVDEVLNFSNESGIIFNYSGMPYVRTILSSQVEEEIFIFLGLTAFLTSLILYFFLRSFKAVILSLVVVLVAVIWSFGLMALLGFKITILTSLIPPLVIVIGIPNCIFLLNKYFSEFKSHGNQAKSLTRVIDKVGNATLMTNATTAAGFATFALTSSVLLKEFGIVASLSIMSVFILSILIVPIVYSFFAPPDKKHYKHLDYPWVNGMLNAFVKIAVSYRGIVYMFLIFSAIVAGYGISKLNNNSLIVDDIKDDNPVKIDLRYYENTLGGIIPFEILIDTKKKGKALKLSTLKRVQKLYDELERYPEFGKPMSVLDVIKSSKQAFYNGDINEYELPLSNEIGFIYDYASRSSTSSSSVMSSYLDEDRRELRVSLKMKDIGTKKLDQVVLRLNTTVDEIFNPDKYDVTFTGVGVIATKGVNLLIYNLMFTLFLAIVLISVIMAFMFRNARMVLISILPNLIPLVFTAAIMGYFNINIKPSTILVFSIAFGISVDDTIHFLSKYRQELLLNNMNIKIAVIKALKETGVSMIYTSVVLFFGFGVFMISNFGGTQALGMLVAMTLLIAMLSNLILLPSLLLTLDNLIAIKKSDTDFFDEVNEKDLN
ncbi:MAG: putative RND superfamily exporter protein [Saprospiraceae bacterium]|jgi:predicted RND superfamily exporter protein